MVCNWLQGNFVRSTLNQRCTDVWCQVAWVTSFVWWCIMFVGLQCRTCFASPFWHSEFGIDPRLMENLCTRGVNIYFERKTTFFDTSLVLTTDELIVLMSALLNDWWSVRNEPKGMWKEMALNEFGILSQHLPGWTAETPKTFQLGQPVSGLRFETQIIFLPPWLWYWSVAFSANTHWLNDVFADVRTECRCTDVCSSRLPGISGLSCSSCCI